MSSVIVVTNFTASSRNALEYACGFMQGKQVEIILLRVFSFSSGFAGEGISMAALTEVSEADERMLQEEKERVQALFPDTKLETKLVSGQFIEALQEQIETEEARLVVMGMEADYNELLSWDNHIIDAFIDMPVPVLMVPAALHFAGMTQIAFACNYKSEDLAGPVQTLRRLLQRTGARLHFVHINRNNAALQQEELEWKARWQNELAEENVLFYELQGSNVVAALDEFCKSKAIDLLVIRPHRAGIWTSIFGSSNTRAIAHMNQLPVLALRGGGV